MTAAPPDPAATTDAAAPQPRQGAAERVLKWVVQRLDAWWVLPLLALLAGLDMFVWIVPTDLLVLSTALLRPRRWWRLALWVTTGSALGMLAFAYGVALGGPLFRHLFEAVALSSLSWSEAKVMADRHAPWALFVIALNPALPPQPAIALAVISGLRPWAVLPVVFAGRLCKYAVYAFLAAKAPRLVARLFGGRLSGLEL